MGSRIVKVFYDQSCYPFKDSERTIRYPITGSSFAGSSNVNELHFYVRDIGDVNNLSWVAIVKLPNGKILYQLLTDIHLDSEINEYYVTFNLSQFYTQLKGDIYISLNGCMGQVEITTDEETDISTIQGEIDSRTVVATGAVKFSINYAPQRPVGFSFDLDQYQTIINALANKANVMNTIQIVTDVDDLDSSNYNEGQLFYDLASQEYYQLNQYGAFIQVLLDSKHHLNRYVLANGSHTTLIQLYNLFGERLAVVNDVLFQLSEYSGSGTNASAFDLATHEYFYANNIAISSYFDEIFDRQYQFTYRKTTSSRNVVYATDNTGGDTEIAYSVNAESNKIVRRDANGQIKVPLTPSANADATSKKYVDDNIATIKANAFILVDTTLYPTLQSFLASTGEEGYIYLYPVDESDFDEGDPQHGYYQYIWEGSEWLSIGTTKIDLSDYYTKSQVNTIANGKVDKTSNASKLYGTNASGNQTTISFTSSNNGSTIPLRDNDGNIGVALAPTNNMHATSKYYVDAQYTILNNAKVDKTSTANQVYGTASNGTQKTFDVDNTVGADGNIVRRASGTSQIMVPLTPTANGHASSKKYVDDSIATAISTVYKIKGSATVAQINTMSTQQVGDVYNLLDSGTITLGELQVFTGDNIVWLGSAWDKLGAEIDWTAYDEKFIAAGFFEVQPYNESTGEITFVYSTELYVMSYDSDTGVMTIEAN